MAYDICVMRTGTDGKIDYRFPGLNDRIVGKEKLAQHFIKHLYDDNRGALLKTIREKKSWDSNDVKMCIMSAYRHTSDLQTGKNMHPQEKIVGIKIDKIEDLRKQGSLNIIVTLKTSGGDVTLEL